MATKSGKQKQKKQKKALDDDNGGDKTYFRWTFEMERELANILRDERNMGNKGDGGWKAVAMKSASDILSAQFNNVITPDNVRNRVKLWKRHYGIVSDILAQSGFSWDGTKQMITMDDEAVWNDYVKSHEDAKQFRFKVIANWDDIVDLCGKDRATGEGAESAFDAEEVIGVEDDDSSEEVQKESEIGDIENAPNSVNNLKKKRRLSSSSSMPPAPSRTEEKKTGGEKKGGEKKGVSIALDKLVSFLEEYIGSKKANSLDVKEILEVVTKMPGLTKREVYKACRWLVENEKHFRMLQTFPEDEKKDYLFDAMPQD